ncbi:MAG: hypothetical protein PHR87_09085 [Sulfurospirillaceae bacterium]|nr:hypothetical protein [Sulfurospirillaceae bacterium]
MILYDKSGLFLGMGNQELYSLGYEDMDEFKNYHNDFAELFVNKPGYIFKFKNFSWIDYTLHSGTPNKRIIIKTKSGKEIESSLIIHEIFLDHSLNGSTLCYCIELSNNTFKTDTSLNKNTTSVIESVPEPIFKAEEVPHYNSFIEDAPFAKPTATFSEEYSQPNMEPTVAFSSNTVTFELPKAYEDAEEIAVRKVPEDDIQPGFKLKIDQDILKQDMATEESTSIQAPLEYASIDDIRSDDFSFAPEQEQYPEDTQKDLLNDHSLLVEKEQLFERSFDQEPFDLSDCAEHLGLDISTIASIMSEYSDELTTKLKMIEENMHTNKLHEANQEVVKLKSIALNLNMLSMVDAFAFFQKTLEAGNYEDKCLAFNALQQAIVDFKETIQ